MNEDYRTLLASGEDSFIVKKSKFIGYGSPARTEEDALGFLAQIRQKHRDAAHNCWAYIIGRNEGIMRYSDDGEPGGTAGMPILEVIRARRVVDCCVVVTRYFGGILLGAGGLVRAYAQGAKIAIDASGIIIMEDSLLFWAGIAYTQWGRVEHYLQNAPVLLRETDFGASITATLLVRLRDQESVFAELTHITEGRIELLPLETLSHGWPMAPEGSEPSE